MSTYQPPSHFAFDVTAGPVRSRGDLRLRAVDEGTEVTFRLDAPLSGIKKMLMERMVQKSMDSEVGALERAKRVLEGSP